MTTFTYDARGRLTQSSLDAAGTPASTTFVYDGVGQITKITQPNGAFESYAYDGAHRLTTVTNAAGETINYTRDAASDVTTIAYKLADGTTTYARSQSFDALGRMISKLGAGSQSYQFAYDNNNNLIKITDPLANIRQYGYDALDRRITDTDEEANTATLTRDWTDGVTSYNDARGLTTTYGRNGFGETTNEVSPDRGTIAYTRDVRGLVTTMTDGRGMSTYYVYDALGRLTNKDYTNGVYWQSFAWDVAAPNAKGRLAGLYSEAGTSWHVFDAKGRITADYRTNNPAPALATQYSYDAAGNILHILYPSGRVINYARDAAGRISAVTTQQTLSAGDQTIVYNVKWNPYGPLNSMTFGYGAVAKFTTDTNYRVTRVQVGTGGSPDGVLDRSYSWTGDIVNSIIDNKNPGSTPGQYGSQSQSFTYTPTRRLATANGYYGPLSWTYDANGNRLTETANGVTSNYAYPTTSNRLSSVTPAGGTARSFYYFGDGSTLADTRVGALGMNFEYDMDRRLSKAYLTNASANAETYGYDTFNHLASRKVASGGTTTTTLYIHDLNNHIIAETDAAGVTLREYIWLNDLPVAVVDKVNTASPQIYFVHTDHLGRPARMVNSAWTWVWDVIYAPFGGVSAIFTNPAVQDMRFPGQWFQAETSLAYNWNRHYDATLGRYTRPDPLGYGGGRNLYGYVDQNPLAYSDPRGLCPQCVLGFGAALIALEAYQATQAIVSELTKNQSHMGKYRGPTDEDELDEDENARHCPPASNAKEPMKNTPEKGTNENTPSGNTDQNKISDDAAREAGLNEAQKAELHDAIHGQDYDYQQILDAAKEIARGSGGSSGGSGRKP